MSLRKAIERYANGVADASEVIAALPKPKKQKSKPSTHPLGELADSESGAITEGTWEEVAFAHLSGDLSDDQYAELHKAYVGS